MHIARALFASVMLGTAAMANTPLKVEAVIARMSPDIRVDVLVGEIVARDTLSASFSSGGRVASVAFDEGDKVPKGAVLARMESVQQEQAVRAAEAGVSTAEADYRQAIENLDRQTALLERGATTRIAKDAAEDALRVAEGGLAQARAELDRARTALEDTVLLAPADATVTSRNIEAGQVVGAAQTVFELALGDRLDAVFDVPEALLTSAGRSLRIELQLLGQSSAAFAGTVREVSPLVDATTGTVSVKVGIGTAPPEVTYGSAVRGTSQRRNVDRIILPYTAMSATKDGPAVWVVDPETKSVSLKQVVVDRFETGRIYLAGGIDPGEMVVTKGSHLLFPGRLVSVVEASQ